MKSRANQAVKRKKNMLLRALFSLMGAFLLGFFLTLILSLIKVYRSDFPQALADLLMVYSNLVLELANRNLAFANLVLNQQTLITVKASSSLVTGKLYLAENFTFLDKMPQPSGAISLVFAKVQYFFSGLFYLVVWSFKVDLLKFVSVFASFMVFIFSAILGFLDGLLARYIRTAEGGRESTYAYHYLADLIFIIPFFLVMAYIALPLPVNPLFIVAVIAGATFVFCRISAANLKKFI